MPDLDQSCWVDYTLLTPTLNYPTGIFILPPFSPPHLCENLSNNRHYDFRPSLTLKEETVL